MAQSLPSIQAKLRRADETIAVLSAEIHTFLNADPKPYAIVGRHDPMFLSYGFFGTADPIPLRFSILVGEVTHQLRSSLDHVMWALAMKHGSPDSRAVQFPLSVTRKKYEDALARGSAPISPEALELLERIQPYNTASPDSAPLFLLSQLNNADKHKLLAVVGAAAAVGDHTTVSNVPGVPIPDDPAYHRIVLPHFPVPAAILGATEILVYSVGFEKPSPHLALHEEFDVELAFDEPGSLSKVHVVPKLRLFHRVVSTTVDLFAPLL